MVAQQPFPEVVFKDRQLAPQVLTIALLHGPLLLALLPLTPPGATTEVVPLSPVRAQLVSLDGQPVPSGGKKGRPLLEHAEQPLAQGRAAFPLTFTQGSRHAPVALTFAADLEWRAEGQTYRRLISSQPSQPLVVITNEAQWESSAFDLFLLDCFPAQRPLPWLAFCNALQRHFLRATRQDPARPERYLSKKDFDFFRTRFCPDPLVTVEQFGALWSFLGKVLQEVRYKRPLFRLFATGILYGCLGKEDVQLALTGHPVGTALLRWSER